MSKGKVCLAYSGGLDTSVILAWLLDQGYEVVAFMANVGQEEDFDAAKEKALKIGACKFVCVDCREDFVKDILFPAVQVNAVYEDVYLLGTSLARPVIAKAQIDVAKQEAVSRSLMVVPVKVMIKSDSNCHFTLWSQTLSVLHHGECLNFSKDLLAERIC